MGDPPDLSIWIELNPAQVTQRPCQSIHPMARHRGRIEIDRALPIARERDPFSTPAAELVVHVAKHHQRHRAISADALNRQG